MPDNLRLTFLPQMGKKMDLLVQSNFGLTVAVLFSVRSYLLRSPCCGAELAGLYSVYELAEPMECTKCHATYPIEYSRSRIFGEDLSPWMPSLDPLLATLVSSVLNERITILYEHTLDLDEPMGLARKAKLVSALPVLPGAS